MNSKNRPSDTIRKFFNFFFFIRETCISPFRKCLVEQSRLLAEGLIPRSLGWNLGPGLILGFIPVISLIFGANFRASSAEILKNEQAQKFVASSKSEVHFLENKGQMVDMDGHPVPFVFFKMETPGLDMYITERGLTYVFVKIEEEHEDKNILSDERGLYEEEKDEKIRKKWERIDMTLKGASIRKENISKENPVQGHFNYFLSHCSDGIYEVKEYEKITIENIYPGIDWVFYNSDTKGFKYDFIVHPGANHKQIELVYSSPNPLNLNGDGGMEIKTQLGTLTENAPISYQGDNEIPSSFIKTFNVMNDKGGYNTHVQFAFTDAAHFPFAKGWEGSDLIIDPQLEWATFLGGNGLDGPMAMDIDQQGNVFVTGYTLSTNFPVENSGTFYQGVKGDVFDGDVFILKFSNTGKRLWCTYYGGEKYEMGTSIAIDKDGNIFLVGHTSSTSFPVQDAPGTYFQKDYSGGMNSDAFILKFNNSGVRIWASYYGGTKQDVARSIALDKNGYFFVTGHTASDDFPLQDAGTFFQPAFGGDINGSNIFIMKFNNNGARLWSTYYGTQADKAACITTDIAGNIFITGGTTSLDFLVYDAGTFFQKDNGNNLSDAFILKFDNAGNRLWATYYGGLGNDYGHTIITDDSSNIFVSGLTYSTSFPVQDAGTFFQGVSGGGPYKTHDAFILKFDNAGNRLWASLYGGSGDEYANTLHNDGNLAVDACGNVYLSFLTQSTDMLTQPPCDIGGFYDNTFDGVNDLFIAQFSNSGILNWATYLGGNGSDYRGTLAIDISDNLFVAGEWGAYPETVTIDPITYPLTDPGGEAYFDGTHNNNDDGCILKFKTDNGCKDIVCKPIIVPDSSDSDVLFIPNAFSPNEDGQNDVLYFKGSSIQSFIIFNRWGEKVFETEDLTKGWDGTYKGEKLNSDIFTYQLKIISTEGEKKQKTGTVALIR